MDQFFGSVFRGEVNAPRVDETTMLTHIFGIGIWYLWTNNRWGGDVRPRKLNKDYMLRQCQQMNKYRHLRKGKRYDRFVLLGQRIPEPYQLGFFAAPVVGMTDEVQEQGLDGDQDQRSIGSFDFEEYYDEHFLKDKRPNHPEDLEKGLVYDREFLIKFEMDRYLQSQHLLTYDNYLEDNFYYNAMTREGPNGPMGRGPMG